MGSIGGAMAKMVLRRCASLGVPGSGFFSDRGLRLGIGGSLNIANLLIRLN